MKLNSNIYLIGFMGSGKSRISRELASLTGADEIDTDAVIVSREGRPITEIFEKSGEEYFRDLESDLLEETARGPKVLVSCGGGIILREKNRSLMKESGCVVWLSASPETIYKRVKNSTDRPLLNGHMNVEYISRLLEARLPRYEAAMTVKIDTDGKEPSEIAREILEKIENL